MADLAVVEDMEVHRLRRLVQELENLVHVPGLMRCDKCKLQVVFANLCPVTGEMGVDNSPHLCLNGCGGMRRVTERECRKRLAEDYDLLLDRLRSGKTH